MKQKYLDELRRKISSLPRKEVAERLNFYSEMIDDMVEAGLDESEAVAKIGSVDSVAQRIIADAKLAKQEGRATSGRRKLSGWKIALIAAGSPLWLCLGVAAFAVALALYIALWAVIICLWAAFVSMVAGSLAGVVYGIAMCFTGNGAGGMAFVGASLALGGLGILAFFGCRAATLGAVKLTKKIALGLKKCFNKGERI